MSGSKVSVGTVVLTSVDPRTNNGSDEAPAIVTRVLDTEDKETRVNLRVLLDGDETLNLRNVPFDSKKPKDEDSDDEDAPATQPAVKRAAWSV